MSESKIFVPYRAVGLISNHIPLVVRYADHFENRKEDVIVTAVGNCFHTYTTSKLRLIGVSKPCDSPISAMVSDGFHVFTANSNEIFCWQHSNELKIKYGKHSGKVHKMLPFGPHLISIDSDNILYAWDIKTATLYLQMEFPISGFEITAVMHPATYLNKVLLGSRQGKLQLWNLKTSKLIHTFSGWGSKVEVLEQSPACDVVAVGLENGNIILHNLKYDDTVVEFKQEWGKVTSISFRTDDVPYVVTGSELGHIAVWDLKERRLSSQVQSAHRKSVTGLKCLPGEPLMVTSSADNTLKIWIFDLPDGGARLLKLKEGHGCPPLMAKFYGYLGDTLISAGEDSVMRLFSVFHDRFNKSLGQASYNRKAVKKKGLLYERLKLPPITCFSSESAREKSWDNVAAIHRGTALVTSWSVNEQKMGKHKFLHKRFKELKLFQVVATCVELTVCGSYVIIGYSSGHLDKYNIQSGIFRGSFGDPSAHEDSVRGVVCDCMNSTVVSGSQNGDLKWWVLSNLVEVGKVEFGVGISKMSLHRDSGLLAVALEDQGIHVIDIDTRTVVRKLSYHRSQVTDTAFSADSRWLVSCSADKMICTWDLPSGACVDCFIVSSPVTSLSISPVGDFMATTHAGHLGIYLWANKTCFLYVSLIPLPSDYQMPTVALPSAAADVLYVSPEEEEEEAVVEHSPEALSGAYKSPDQISEDLVTLALLPTSRWLNLLKINVIKKSSKPTEPPTVAQKAPFFIPVVPGLDFKFAEPSDEKDSASTKIKNVSSFETLTEFGGKLKLQHHEEAFQMLMSLGPSAVDLEIRSLDPEMGGSQDVLLEFLEMITVILKKRHYFEAAQGYLGLFLKIHSDFITDNAKAVKICESLSPLVESSWNDVKEAMNQSLCLISYFKNAALINY